MAEMMYLVRYYCEGSYYREKVPEYNLKQMKHALNRQRDCALISETQLGIDPTVEVPLYFPCVPYTIPSKNAVVDDPTERTRIEQIRENSPEELAEFILWLVHGSIPKDGCLGCMVKWLMSPGPLVAEEDC